MKLILLVVVLALEPGAIYLGFVARRLLLRWYAQAAALMLPLIALALGYEIWQESSALQRLASHIDPYPGIASTLWVPPIPGTRAEHWIFKTPDGRADVSRYYADESHRRGWTAVERSSGPTSCSGRPPSASISSRARARSGRRGARPPSSTPCGRSARERVSRGRGILPSSR